MTRGFFILLFFAAMAVSAGCMTPNQAPTSLEGMRSQEARKLAMQCYADREGERLFAGPQAVYLACSRWAHAVVQVRYRQTVPVASAFN